MTIQYNDFIGIYTGVYPEGYCQHLISEFDRLAVTGAASDRMQAEKALPHIKNDLSMPMALRGHDLKPFNNADPVDMFFQGLQGCFDHYVEKFSTLREGRIRANTMKVQRTGPGGGYHIWHAEQNGGDQADRVLVYMLYLNTLEPHEAGETEFLYQKQRYNPTENQMLLWPAAYTHTHRGNAVFGDRAKYIVTGWFYYD